MVFSSREIAATGRPVRPPACIITGGETTVTLRGKGLGGRNQEFALHCARALSDPALYPAGARFLLSAKLTDRLGGPQFLYAYHGDPVVVLSDDTQTPIRRTLARRSLALGNRSRTAVEMSASTHVGSSSVCANVYVEKSA